ncbi:tellurite resistance TerB family protein [Microvirga rosea]|uniref:tellurite resistance TerB family protein n=1 Tax=Microvirga rosea TaxID=2715425 RepID=UPI001D0A0071|nr:tellurite resistance TerB family protein [Microvirga rosea]MCB8822468.1 tellurite resistance TerB family protein [Microvirga rosea]
MVDYRKLLDAVVGALAKPDQGQAPGASGAASGSSGSQTGTTSLPPVLDKAKELATKHPALAQAALLGLAGLMFGKRKKGGIAGGIAKLGGLAVIGGLAYKAYQSQKGRASETAAMDTVTASPLQMSSGVSPLDVPETSRFHPVSQTEDDAMRFLRAMVAAAAADGQIDQIERERITRGLAQAGIDPEATRWLDREMETPVSVDELADGVEDPELAAQVYAAALLAIDPDTLQEHEFLRQLADALDLDPKLKSQIEETIGAAR